MVSLTAGIFALVSISW